MSAKMIIAGLIGFAALLALPFLPQPSCPEPSPSSIAALFAPCAKR